MIGLENLTPEEICTGFTEENGTCTCVYCGKRFENGEVFPVGDRFFTAHRAAELHAASHSDRLEQIIAAGEKNLSLTENQKNLL